jgi:aminopeptidase 2
LNTSDLALETAYVLFSLKYSTTRKFDLNQSRFRSLYSDVLKVDQVLSEQTLDKASERVAYNLSATLPAGSKASLKVSLKGELTGSMMGYYKSSYEKDGNTKYYALTQFEVSRHSSLNY